MPNVTWSSVPYTPGVGTNRPIGMTIPYSTTFNPKALGNLTVWLDASQDPTGNGNSIASLTDRSGNGYSMTPTGTITAATNFLGGKTVYNFGSSRASYTNFPWQTSFTQIVLVKCSTGRWLSSLVTSGASYIAYIYAGNDNLINVNNSFNPLDSSYSSATSVFTAASGGVSSWVIFSIGYQSGATSASNYTINGSTRTTASGSSIATNPLATTNQFWLNGNGSTNFDTGTYVAEMLHFNAVLSDTQRQQVESYLAEKWGLIPQIPANHLYYSAPAGLPTPTFIRTIMSQAITSPIVTAGLLFHLDAGNPSSYSGSGSTWNDLAGSGLTTTLYNSPTYSSANGGYLSFVASSSQYAQTSASLSLLTTFTVEVWHYYNGTYTGGQPCILSEIYVGGGINFFLGALLVSAPQLQVGFFNGSFNVTPSGYTLPANGWYHLVGTFDGSSINLYVNNVLTQTQATSQTPTSGANGIRFMRRWDNPEYWGGNLAIIRIYNGAIGASDVSTNYSASKARFGL